MEERMSNYNELQNNISAVSDAQTSPFCLFSLPQLFSSIISINTNLPVLNHVRPAFPFRRGNPDVGSK
jgi:hypothetical protein